MKITRFEDIDAWKAGYLKEDQFDTLHAKTVEVKKLIGGFIRYLRSP